MDLATLPFWLLAPNTQITVPVPGNYVAALSSQVLSCDLIGGATYKVCYATAFIKHSDSTNNELDMKISINGSTSIPDEQASIGNAFFLRSGFFYYTPSATNTVTFTIAAAAQKSGTATLYSPKLSVERVGNNLAV